MGVPADLGYLGWDEAAATGRLFYVLTDGGRVNSPDGIARKSAMLRGELATYGGL